MSEPMKVSLNMEECLKLANEMADSFIGRSAFEAIAATALVMKVWRQQYPHEVEAIELAIQECEVGNEITLRNGEDA